MLTSLTVNQMIQPYMDTIIMVLSRETVDAIIAREQNHKLLRSFLNASIQQEPEASQYRVAVFFDELQESVIPVFLEELA